MITLLYAERETHRLPANVMVSLVPTGCVALIPLLQTALHVFPLLAHEDQLILVLGSHNCSEVLRQLWTLATLPWSCSRTNTASPQYLHPLHCRQAAPHGPQCPMFPSIAAWCLSWAVLTAHPLPSPNTGSSTSPPAQQAVAHEEEEQAAVQRFSTPGSVCQELLYSLPHQPAWLHCTWDRIKGYRRFPQVKISTYKKCIYREREKIRCWYPMSYFQS